MTYTHKWAVAAEKDGKPEVVSGRASSEHLALKAVAKWKSRANNGGWTITDVTIEPTTGG